MKKEPQPKAPKVVLPKAVKAPKEVAPKEVLPKAVKEVAPKIIKVKATRVVKPVPVEAVETPKELEPFVELIQATIPAEVPVLGEYRRPTLIEELAAFHMLAWDLNFHRTISMNNAAINSILARIDSWVSAHGSHNGEHSQQDIDTQVVTSFWEKLSKEPAIGKKPRVK